jgi:hypothetical protein
MRFSIRYQLLLPLLALMLGLVAASTWSAWSSGQRARRQIETQIDDIATTLNVVPFPLTMQTLRLLKGLTGAEFLLTGADRMPMRDDEGSVFSTLPDLPDELPAPTDRPTQHFDKPVQVGRKFYLCGGIPLRNSIRPGTLLYILYPESLWQEAAWQALRPALSLGIVGSLVSVLLSVLLTRGLSRRIQELDRRTRCRCLAATTSCSTWANPSTRWPNALPRFRTRSAKPNGSACSGRFPAGWLTSCATASREPGWRSSCTSRIALRHTIRKR